MAPTAPITPAAPTLPALPSFAPADAAPLMSPLLILGLCVAAALGTILLLPGTFRVAWRRIGGAILFSAAVFFGIALFVSAEDRPGVYFWIFAAIALLGSARVVTHEKPVYSALYFVLTVFASAGLFILLYAEFMAVALVTIYAGAILVTYTFVIMLAADAAPSTKNPDEAAREFLAEFDARSRSPWAAGTIGFLLMGVLLFVIFDRAPRVLEPRGSLTDARYLSTEAGRLRSGALGAQVEAGEVAAAPAINTDSRLENPATVDDNLAVAAASDGDPSLALARRGDLYAANNLSAYAAEMGGIQVLGVYLFTRQIVTLQVAGLILTVAMVGAIVIARKGVIPDLQPKEVADVETGQSADHASMTLPHTPVEDNPHSLNIVGTGDPRQKAYPQN